jgi:hypothetical protein
MMQPFFKCKYDVSGVLGERSKNLIFRRDFCKRNARLLSFDLFGRFRTLHRIEALVSKSIKYSTNY